MAKWQDYDLKGALDSFILLIRQATDLLNGEKEDAKPLEEILIKLLDEMEAMKDTIRTYVGRDIDVPETDDIFSEDDEYVYIRKNHLKGMLDSAAFLSRQIIDLVNAEAGSSQIIDKLEKLYGEIDIAIPTAEYYKYYYVTNHEEELADLLGYASYETRRVLDTMRESDISGVKELLIMELNEILEYYDFYLHESTFKYELEYNDSQSREKKSSRHNIEEWLEEFIELAEKAMDSMDCDSLNEAANVGGLAAYDISKFLKLGPDDMSKVPKLLQHAWEINELVELIEVYLEHQRGIHEKEQEEENKGREPDASAKLKEILKAILGNARPAASLNVDNRYLDMLRDELEELEVLIMTFSRLKGRKEDIDSYIDWEGNTFMELLEKFSCTIKSHNEELLKRKFIEVEETNAECQRELWEICDNNE